MSTSEESPRPQRRRIAGERTRPRSPALEGPPPITHAPSRPRSKRAPADSAVTPARGRWALWLPALVVVTVIAAVLAAVLGYRASRAQADPAAAAPAKDAVASAADATETLLSFRYDTLARELDEEASLMTQAYAQRFGSTFSAQARARLTEQQMMTESTVLAAARLECGEDCPSDRVQVLVFFDKMTTKGAGDPEYTPDRAILSMQRDGSVWLVDEIRTV